MGYVCDKCGKIFTRNKLFTQHINRKTPCVKDFFKCGICGFETTKKTLAEKHQNRKIPCNMTRVENNKLLRERIENAEKECMKAKKEMSKIKRISNYKFISDNFLHASNLEDCLNRNNITDEMIAMCEKMTLREGAIFVLDVLCNGPIDTRPFHCSDANRGNYIIRSNDEWRVDAGGEQIKACINPVVTKIYDKIYDKKMRNADENDIEQRMLNCTAQSTEMTTQNVEKQCAYAVRSSANNYIINFNLLR